MNTVKAIQEKLDRLPPAAQAEALAAVEQIERRYQAGESRRKTDVEREAAVHPLTLIANIAIDAGVTDLAERHDFYAHGKLED